MRPGSPMHTHLRADGSLPLEPPELIISTKKLRPWGGGEREEKEGQHEED